jgi:hypothetical protein
MLIMKKYNVSIHDCFEIAEKKLAVDGWRGYAWERSSGGDLVTGRSENPHEKPCEVFVSHADQQSHAAVYEATTGLCWDCKGTGEVFKQWTRARGNENEICERCAGSKKV